jgi:hypothetical protein
MCWLHAIPAQEHDSAGELSLLAMRPLWYSLVTTSDSATVLSIDLAAVRDYLASSVSPVGVARSVVGCTTLLCHTAPAGPSASQPVPTMISGV